MEYCIVLVALVAIISSLASADNINSSTCSIIWHLNETCGCGQDLKKAIICSGDKVYLRIDYAMIWDSIRDETIVAISRYSYHDFAAISQNWRVYSLMPNHTENLNETVCGRYKREGYLCGRCRYKYGPSAYSSRCLECKLSVPLAIILFITIKILPIFVLFMLIMTFRINIICGPMLGYIIFCQAHIAVERHSETNYRTLVEQSTFLEVVKRISFFLSAIWDLDFLQLTHIVPPFCISHKLWDFDVLLIDYFSVLFPLCLVVLTYILIQLHARDCRIVVYCWKPFHSCFVRIRRNWSASDSIIHAYASLLLLSFLSLNYNAFQILRSTNVFNAGGVVKRNVLVNHPSIHVYTGKYIYYCVITLTLLLFLGILPSLLLLLHPIQMFRAKLQRYCSQRLLLGLNTFVETFQGPFKDGCNGTRDFRIIPGVVTSFTLLLNVLTCSAHVGGYQNYAYPFVAAVLTPASVLCAYAHPCKSSIANLSLTFHLLWLSCAAVVLTLWWQDLALDTIVLSSLLAIFVSAPHVLMLIWVLYRLGLKNCLCLKACFNFVVGQQGQFNIQPQSSDVFNTRHYRELT